MSEVALGFFDPPELCIDHQILSPPNYKTHLNHSGGKSQAARFLSEDLFIQIGSG